MFTLFDSMDVAKSPKCLDCVNSCTRTTKMDKFFGHGQKGILIVLDKPTEQEDKDRQPYSSMRVRSLAQEFGKLGINIFTDCFITYAIACWSPQGEKKTKEIRPDFKTLYPLTPFAKQMSNCSPGIAERLKDPRVNCIVPLGKNAINAVLEERIVGRISSVQRKDYYGEHIPDQVLKKWVCPTYCAQDMFIGGKDFFAVADIHRQEQLQWLTDNYALPVPTYCSEFKTTPDAVFKQTLVLDEAIAMMQEAMNWPFVSFDYEATSLKPQAEYNNIICVAISNGKTTYSFPFYQCDSFLDQFEMLMIDPSKKVAHNAQFEHIWTLVKAGRKTHIDSWAWDTMLAARVLHNTKSSQLKFQVYVNFGVIGYDDYIDAFLESEEPQEETTPYKKTKKGKKNNKSSKNAKNRMELADINKVLSYCGLDAYYTALLYLKQKQHPFLNNTKAREALQFAVAGSIALGDIHTVGFRVDVPALNSTIERLTKEIEQDRKDILLQYPEWNGLTSGSDLGEFIYDTLKCTPKQYTDDDDGNPSTTYSVDKEALTKIQHPFVKSIIPLVAKSTPLTAFLLPIQRELCGEKIHPFFSLDTAKTYRSSSRSPNYQNIPKRDMVQKKLLRDLHYPARGFKLVEYDYKAIEVAVSACVFQDPVLINYVVDQTTDMHRDVAMDIFFRGMDTFTKNERQMAKNGYVFPSFYGSSGYNCGENLWEQVQENPDTLQHLAEHGIINKELMQKHIGAYDEVFWHQRFKVYTQRKRDLYNQYLKDGYLDLVTGFRCYGPMGYTQLVNVPSQGPASHVKLWTLLNVAEQMRKEGMRTQILSEIHDSIIAQVWPDEEQRYHELMIEYGTVKVRQHWPWIIVPLVMEKESTEVDGAWSTIKK